MEAAIRYERAVKTTSELACFGCEAEGEELMLTRAEGSP